MAKTKPSPRDRRPAPESAWISVVVTLVAADDQVLEAAPERALVASPWHTFADLALAIDDAFGRWELGSRRRFGLADGTEIGEVAGRRRTGELDYRRTRLQRLDGSEPFTYTVDDGTRWRHRCVLAGAIDADDVVPDRPGHPVVYQSVGRVPSLAD
ncbi:MAG TPA: hypothetical protein VNT56_03120 [Acidimicrobiales bacterium]|jgi:hypothetical protein|nr:hypothetical protein [Acidimicrobiales bacterium]